MADREIGHVVKEFTKVIGDLLYITDLSVGGAPSLPKGSEVSSSPSPVYGRKQASDPWKALAITGSGFEFDFWRLGSLRILLCLSKPVLQADEGDRQRVIKLEQQGQYIEMGLPYQRRIYCFESGFLPIILRVTGTRSTGAPRANTVLSGWYLEILMFSVDWLHLVFNVGKQKILGCDTLIWSFQGSSLGVCALSRSSHVSCSKLLVSPPPQWLTELPANREATPAVAILASPRLVSLSPLPD
ncbi:hypothetical protein VNO77_37426 [Canavalia gladiata]|uniref:Uncharacterized protein n=1 Tax=Canavalia gladiata TaxID=3824 RepID=A0AAN9KAU5_CANGL